MDLQETQRILAKQDDQIKKIHDAEDLYKENKDIDSLIAFWENIWENGGLLFNGAHWTFRLPDLYIKEKQYDKALYILEKINDPYYENKKLSYIEKIEKWKKKNNK